MKHLTTFLGYIGKKHEYIFIYRYLYLFMIPVFMLQYYQNIQDL
jgi:hypothetical protein